MLQTADHRQREKAVIRAARVLYWLSPFNDNHLDSMGFPADSPIRSTLRELPETLRVVWHLSDRQLEQAKVQILAASEFNQEDAMRELLLFFLLSSAAAPSKLYRDELCRVANFVVTHELILRT